jgi:hypothetical protein
MTAVVLVCSPPRVATAKGSGKPGNGCQFGFEAREYWMMHTEDITLVEPISRNDCRILVFYR